VFIVAPPGGHVRVTRVPYGEHVPDSSEGACSTAAIVVAWTCVVFVAAVAALAQSMVWTFVAAIALVATVVCTLLLADHHAYRADSAPSSGVGSTGVGEDDERVGSW
jgi:hypothetical protein